MKKRVIVYIFTLFPVILYILFFRNYVQEAYHDTAPDWVQQLIHTFYPRFVVEKHRFDLAFFLNKADQVCLRYLLALIFLLILYQLQKAKNIHERFIRIHTYEHYRRLRIIFYAGLLFFTWDWIYDFPTLIELQPFYKPVLLFDLLGIQLHDLWVFKALYFVFIAALVLTLLNIYPVLCSSITAILLVYFQGFFLSFEKIDHGYTTLTYAALLMPFMLHEIHKQLQEHPNSSSLSSWTLFLIQLTIALVYFLSGLEKVLTSGLMWASKHTFQTYLSLHPTPISRFIADHDMLSSLIPILTLAFQFTFILILWFPQWKWIFLISGLLFHLGTKWVMDIGGWFSSWIFVYIFFINWDFSESFSFIKPNKGWLPIRPRYNKKGR